MRFMTVSGSADEVIAGDVLVTLVELVTGDVIEVALDEEVAVGSGDDVTGDVEAGFVLLRRSDDCLRRPTLLFSLTSLPLALSGNEAGGLSCDISENKYDKC